MKRLCLFTISAIISLLITSCSHPNEFRLHAQQDLLQESWPQQINTHPDRWLKGSDPWFFSGEPVNLADYAIKAPIANSMSHMVVRVSQFNSINIDGDFRVQIMGQQERSGVEIIGSNESVRQIVINTSHHTLTLRQLRDPKSTKPNDAIIRIGINNLRNLTHCGNGTVTGKAIYSDNLTINSTCGARILLAGKMNLRQITQAGSSTVTVIGAYSPYVDIKAGGVGSVNVSGRVGVQSISSFGKSRVNIIGADSRRLVITSGDYSITSIAGRANLKSVNASGGSCVFLYWVNSNGLHVNERDAACVNLAGCVTNLQVSLTGSSHFQGGYLKANAGYVTTENQSHATVSANQQLFAQASGISSIYYIGSPSKISRFVTDKGAIIAIPSNDIPTPAVYSPQLTTWDFKGQGGS